MGSEFLILIISWIILKIRYFRSDCGSSEMDSKRIMINYTDNSKSDL